MDETKILNNAKTNISGITERKKTQAPKPDENLRKSGLDIIGDVPWGTHLCQFYKTKEDLLDILIPYFKTGLEDNEFCMWVCWEPLGAEEAKASLNKILPNMGTYIKRGQIEIVDYSRQQTEREDSGFTKMKQFWVDKERQALEIGFEGLRLASNTSWLEKKEWRDFKQYEEEVDGIIKSHKMLAICPYSLDKCDAPEIIDVIGNHKSALIRYEDKWGIIESSERKKAEKALKRSEEELREDKLALEQKNLALKELIEHMERTKNKIKEDIAINVDELITPLLERLEIKGISRKYAKLLRRHLEELASSFGRRITERSTKLSPKEIELCGMIKGGLSSKEISELLNVSYKTIDKHRRNIRKKLGISKKKVNLTSFLKKV